jgi:dTDP-4-amino-4,6-dideoxygalactose transaminase
MLARRQLPVHSPLPADALLGGVTATARRRAPLADRVHEAIALRYGARGVLLTDSGTSALALALRAAERLRSTPVALPAYGCYDLATAADAARLPVVLYDLDPLTLGPNFASLERALQHGARAIVVAHFYGVPVDLDRVRRLAGEYHALVIEDAAQGAGVSYAGRRAGALGSLGVLSFGRGKGITGGGGGALLAGDESGARALATVSHEVGRPGGSLRTCVVTAAQWLLARPSLYELPASLPFLGLGETSYRPPHPAAAPPAFVLGVLERTLPLADEEAERRRRNAERLLAVLGAGSGRLAAVRGAAGATPGYLRLPVLARGGERAAALGDDAARLGIMPAYPCALPDLPGFGDRVRGTSEDFDGARLLASQLVTLPTHGRLDARDLAALEEWLSRATAAPL